MTTTYQVFVTVPSAVSPQPPVETLFSTPLQTPGSVAFDTPVRINESELNQAVCSVDTRISNCGRYGCTECEGTQKITAASPDYEIFRKLVAEYQTGKGVIVCKSTTVTSSTTVDDVATILKAADDAVTATGSTMDIFYLAKWLDRPDQYQTLGTLSGGGKIVRTWNAQGFQAIAFTPTGFTKIRDTYHPDTNPVVCRPFAQVLNTMLQRGTAYGVTATPSLFQYDATIVTLSANPLTPEAPFSYLKTCESRGDVHPERVLTRRISADLSLFWIVVVIITIVISTWLLLKIGAVYAIDI
jgi:hypothetical protein